MRRFTLALVPALVVAAAAGSAAHGAHSLCVGHVPGCFHTIQAAVDAAHDGDTIRIGRGTFAGGVTVEVSVDLIGAGADRTTVAGGGPVLTIGRQDAPDLPTVSIRGVTITGGRNDSQPDTVVVEGGGVWIPHGLGFTTGATVTIADSVITGNSIVPQTTSPFCGDPACAFAFGGGIENEGTLTVENTRVSGNTSGRPGSVTLGAGGGGIVNFSLGTLTMRHSWVTGNRVVVTAPNGQSAESGGLLTAGLATVEDTVVSGNTVEASNVGVEADAFAGGIDVG